MLLKHFYDFAHSRKILEDSAFADKAIRWIIPLNSEGRLSSAGLIETKGDGKKGKIYTAPKTLLDKGVGGIAEFLADGITSLFGLDSNPDERRSSNEQKKREENNRKKTGHFWSQIQDALTATASPLLAALVRFHEHYGSDPPFLRYGQSLDPKKSHLKKRWWVKTALGNEVGLGADQFTFQVDGKLPIEDDAVVRPYWRSLFQGQVADKATDSELGICMVSAKENVPIAKTHLPLIKGIPGGKKQDRKIVSFDKDAFCSYGFKQSANAQVSVEAALAYVKAINWMTQREDHSLEIDNAVILFWARESPVVSGFFARLLKSADPLAVAEFLKAPWAGLDRKLVGHDHFLSVTLSGNGGRVAVRHWIEMPLQQAVKNLTRWFNDLSVVKISPSGGPGNPAMGEMVPPLALKELAKSTVRDQKDIQPMLFVDLYRCAVEGRAMPVTAVQPLMGRLTADIARYGPDVLCTPLAFDLERTARRDRRVLPSGMSRFGLLRLILNRNRKGDQPMIEPKVFETDDAAYNCGRLLAVLANAQAKAHDFKLEGAGVAERYFGAASVSPSLVFPILLGLNRHHLDKIRKSDKFKGHEGFIEDSIQEILTCFTPDGPNLSPAFPRHLDLQAQGRFAIGFYQQKAASDADRKSATSTPEKTADSAKEVQS